MRELYDLSDSVSIDENTPIINPKFNWTLAIVILVTAIWFFNYAMFYFAISKYYFLDYSFHYLILSLQIIPFVFFALLLLITFANKESSNYLIRLFNKILLFLGIGLKDTNSDVSDLKIFSYNLKFTFFKSLLSVVYIFVLYGILFAISTLLLPVLHLFSSHKTTEISLISSTNSYPITETNSKSEDEIKSPFDYGALLILKDEYSYCANFKPGIIFNKNNSNMTQDTFENFKAMEGYIGLNGAKICHLSSDIKSGDTVTFYLSESKFGFNIDAYEIK